MEIRPMEGQVEDLIGEAARRAEAGRARARDDLDQADVGGPDRLLREAGLKVEYLHSDIDAIERVEILRRLRRATLMCSSG